MYVLRNRHINEMRCWRRGSRQSPATGEHNKICELLKMKEACSSHRILRHPVSNLYTLIQPQRVCFTSFLVWGLLLTDRGGITLGICSPVISSFSAPVFKNRSEEEEKDFVLKEVNWFLKSDSQKDWPSSQPLCKSQVED